MTEIDFKIPSQVNVIERKPLAFKDTIDFEEILPMLYKMCEPSITEFKRYDYFDKLIQRLYNDEGYGVAMFSEEGEINNGVGKSLYMTKVYPTILNSLCEPAIVPFIFNCCDFSEEDFAKLLEIKGHRTVILDEVGREPLTIQSYGNIIRPMERIFEKAERQGWKIFLATNMSKSQFVDHYKSDHLNERVRSMCHQVICSGKSSRKSLK